MPGAYYNEIEPYAARWLRNLIAAGLIAPGDVDERSIVEVQPDDLRGYTQAHFFAGIGVWSHAARSAGVADTDRIWTGSCPCQPFSAAGKQRGTDDERHLWPEFHRLIRECRPPVVLGEQVASALGRDWLDAVRADLEALGYAVAAADLGAASVGAPHIRQRLWWVADAQAGGRREQRDAVVARESRHADGGGNASGGLAQPAGEGPQRRAEPRQRVATQLKAAERDGGAGGLADANGAGRQPGPHERSREGAGNGARRSRGEWQSGVGGNDRRPAGPLHGFWRDADWLLCRDGKWRPVEPGTFPLAHGAPARVGRLRAYGNAIVAPLAAEFISAVMECRP